LPLTAGEPAIKLRIKPRLAAGSCRTKVRAERLDRLSADDARILRLERGTVRGHTCKVILLEPGEHGSLPSTDALREHVSTRLDAAPRLRRCLASTPLHLAPPAWVDDQEFDIARHVRPVETRGAVSPPQLDEIVGRLMEERLDRSHPLWQLDVIDELTDGSMALVWRLHHCLADGTTAVRLGSDVLWSEHPDDVVPASPNWSPDACPGSAGLLARGLRDRARQAAQRVPRRGRRPQDQATSVLRSRAAIRRELARTASRSPLDRRIGSTRSIAFQRAPLDDCRRAGKAIHDAVTVNDVVLAIVAGAVREWIAHRHGHDEVVRVKVPVSLHDKAGGDREANRDSYFFVDLPVGEPDPVKRVLAINRETTERKVDRDAEALYRLGLHRPVAHWAMSPRVFTFNVSNVRGPAQPVYVLGARVREMYSLVEVAQRHALRVAVVSACGSIHFGLCADRDAVPDVAVLADGLERSTAELLECAH